MNESHSVQSTKSKPKILFVHPSGLISDPDVRGPLLRNEVIDPPPDFENRDFITEKFISYNTDKAIKWISKYPSLTVKFSEIGYRRIDFLETELLFDHALSAKEKNQLKLELLQLERDDFAIWQNAILSTRKYIANLVQSKIREWMHEPVDFSEEYFFKAGWRDFPYSNQAATRRLNQLSSQTLDELQIALTKCEHIDTKQEFNFYELNQSIKNANKLLRILNLDILFEEF